MHLKGTDGQDHRGRLSLSPMKLEEIEDVATILADSAPPPEMRRNKFLKLGLGDDQQQQQQ